VQDLKEPKLVSLPSIPEGSANVETQRVITLVGQQDLLVKETVTLHGYYGSWMRGNFAADEPSQCLQHMPRIIEEHQSAQVEEFKPA